MPRRSEQIADRNLLEDRLLRVRRTRHSERVVFRNGQIIEQGVDGGRREVGMIVAAVAAKEGTEKPERVSRRQRVLSPQQ